MVHFAVAAHDWIHAERAGEKIAEGQARDYRDWLSQYVADGAGTHEGIASSNRCTPDRQCGAGRTHAWCDQCDYHPVVVAQRQPRTLSRWAVTACWRMGKRHSGRLA